jgi:predicted branched-subunit amino acid permease
VGLGVMAHSQGLSLAETVASTLLAFSISGQTAFIHATASSVPLLPLGVAVLAANIRLLPLAAGVVAHIRRPDGPPGWFNLVVALLTGATAWGSVTRRADRMPKRALASYAFVVAAVLWLVSTAGIGVGWLLLGVIPPALAAGLAFLAAAYFGILGACQRSCRAGLVMTSPILSVVGTTAHRQPVSLPRCSRRR